MGIEREEILWVDSDPEISNSVTVLKNDYKVSCFNETEDLLSYIRNHPFPQRIRAILTSLMERGGRKEKGLKNAYQMIDEIRIIWSNLNLSYSPLFAMNTLTASVEKCREYGIEIVVNGNRTVVQNAVIEQLKVSLERGTRRKISEVNRGCAQLYVDAKKVLEFLRLPRNYFDNFSDFCFCHICEPKLIYKCGNPEARYAIPRGWYRFGIFVQNEYISKREEIENWHIAYHGTHPSAATSILQNKKILFPGDKLSDGTILPVRKGNAWAKNFGNKPLIYLSPTILYASLPEYAPIISIDNFKYQIVFQCRIKPQSYKVFPETLSLKSQIDPDFKNSELEWVTDDRTAVVPYGILIRRINE